MKLSIHGVQYLELSLSLSSQDKTFGIKNKKGKKQQTFIKQVTNQVKFGGQLSIAKVSSFNSE